MKKFLHNIVKRFQSMRQGRTKTEYEIVWDESDVQVKWLTLENDTGSASFSWDLVLAVDTFKRNYFSVDCICLAFQTPNGWLEVNEDMKGFGDFLDAVESRLFGFPPQAEWWRKVMIPAFKTNHARLWTRDKYV